MHVSQDRSTRRIAEQGLPPRRHAWFVFAVLVAADGRGLRRPPGRRLDVPAPQGGVEPVRPPAGQPRLHRLDRRRARHRAAVAARGPLEPREEHRADGRDLERRHHRLRVRPRLRPPARRARASSDWARRPTARRVRRCSPASFPARQRSTVLGAFLGAGLVGSVLGVVLGGVIAENWGWRAASASSASRACARVARLGHRAGRRRHGGRESRDRTRESLPLREVVAYLLRPRTVHLHVRRRGPAAARGLDDLGLDAELLQSLLRARAGRRRTRAPASSCCSAPSVSIGWSLAGRPLVAPRQRRARLYVPAFVAVLTTLFMCCGLRRRRRRVRRSSR